MNECSAYRSSPNTSYWRRISARVAGPDIWPFAVSTAAGCRMSARV